MGLLTRSKSDQAEDCQYRSWKEPLLHIKELLYVQRFVSYSTGLGGQLSLRRGGFGFGPHDFKDRWHKNRLIEIQKYSKCWFRSIKDKAAIYFRPSSITYENLAIIYVLKYKTDDVGRTVVLRRDKIPGIHVALSKSLPRPLKPPRLQHLLTALHVHLKKITISEKVHFFL